MSKNGFNETIQALPTGSVLIRNWLLKVLLSSVLGRKQHFEGVQRGHDNASCSEFLGVDGANTGTTTDIQNLGHIRLYRAKEVRSRKGRKVRVLL